MIRFGTIGGCLIAAAAGLGALAAQLVRPPSVWADAVWTGDPTGPVGQGGPDALSALLGYATGIGALAVAIAILVAIGYGVARIGGPPTDPHDASPTDSPAAGQRPSSLLAGAFLAAAAIGAFLAGRATAGASSAGGLSGVFAVVYLVVLGGAVVIGLVIVGLAATAFRRGHLSRAIATMFIAAALVMVGALGGELTAGATGALPHEPVVLRAGARLHLDLDTDGMSLAFAARDDGLAECRSGPDTRTVSDLSGLDLGELGPATMRVGITLGPDGNGPASVQLFVDGGDLPEGAAMVAWSGTAAATPTGPGSSAGRLTFADLPLSRSDGKPAPDATPPSDPAWPSMLSGTMTWTCDTWTNEPLGDGSAPGPSVGATAPSGSVAPSTGPIGRWQLAPDQAALRDVTFEDVIWTGQRFVATGSTSDGGGVFADSADGLTWHQQAASGPAYPARLAAGPPGLIAIGTIDSRWASWTSPDGLTWVSRADAFPVGVVGPDSFSVTDVTPTATGWLAVGREDPPCQTNCGLAPVRALAWTSVDGLHWSSVADQPWLAGAAITAISKGGPGFIAVGIANTTAAAWTSPDGSVWTRAVDEPAFHELPAADPSLWTTMADVASGHDALVAVGWDGPGGAHGPAGRAWWSRDGRSWTDAEGQGFPSGGEVDVRLERVVTTPSGFLATGFSTGSCTGGIWASTDGTSWQCLAADAGFQGFSPSAVASSLDVEVVVGHAATSDGAAMGAVWRRSLP